MNNSANELGNALLHKCELSVYVMIIRLFITSLPRVVKTFRYSNQTERQSENLQNVQQRIKSEEVTFQPKSMSYQPRFVQSIIPFPKNANEHLDYTLNHRGLLIIPD